MLLADTILWVVLPVLIGQLVGYLDKIDFYQVGADEAIELSYTSRR